MEISDTPQKLSATLSKPDAPALRKNPRRGRRCKPKRRRKNQPTTDETKKHKKSTHQNKQARVKANAQTPANNAPLRRCRAKTCVEVDSGGNIDGAQTDQERQPSGHRRQTRWRDRGLQRVRCAEVRPGPALGFRGRHVCVAVDNG